ncbi:hypothetical protein G3O00_38280 [Burkholderia sp. Ac-20384]|uniref:hypothetical protein n=1 Tax=Burkholderia sp. Ac-20384 TaxID=2703902 RepID=UPI0019806D20|nr:hypothetical protein [Burkholderia sp. Ac-20384]MBN3829409.1 hypothetical protein [Burkholderia sp. Ac-20384]
MTYLAEPGNRGGSAPCPVNHRRAATATAPVLTIGTSGRRQHRTLPGIAPLSHAYPGFLSNSVIFIHIFDTATLNHRTNGNQTLFDDINGFADSMASKKTSSITLESGNYY